MTNKYVLNAYSNFSSTFKVGGEVAVYTNRFDVKGLFFGRFITIQMSFYKHPPTVRSNTTSSCVRQKQKVSRNRHLNNFIVTEFNALLAYNKITE